MQSLRTRRSQAPPRKAQRTPTKLSKPGANGTPLPRKKSQTSRVDDKIKKRMSTRYADISGPTDVNVPPMPSVPAALRPGERRGGDEAVRRRVDYDDDDVQQPKVAPDDNKLLDKDDFDPDDCMWRDSTVNLADSVCRLKAETCQFD
jgi:exocyst complex component 8